MDKKANGEGSQIDLKDHREQASQLRFVEEGVKTNYANTFNIGFGQEEVVFLFGTHFMNPGVVRIENKVAVSMKTAKRLAVTLSNLLRRYEAVHGDIDVSSQKQASDETPNVQ